MPPNATPFLNESQSLHAYGSLVAGAFLGGTSQVGRHVLGLGNVPTWQERSKHSVLVFRTFKTGMNVLRARKHELLRVRAALLTSHYAAAASARSSWEIRSWLSSNFGSSFSWL
jgi:hypothetical protein